MQGALLTGCRYFELVRLKASNFNSDSATLAIRLAKGKIRHVLLTERGIPDEFSGIMSPAHIHETFIKFR